MPWVDDAPPAPPPAGGGWVSDAPGQIEGFGRAPALYGSALAKGGLEGVGAIGDLQGLLQRAVDPAADWVARQLGIKPNAAPTPPPTLGSQNLVGMGKTLGLVDRPDLQPRTTGERYGVAGTEMAGSMLPYAAMGGGNAAVDAARALLQGGTGGVAGQAAAELFPEHPTLGRIAGNVLGGLAGGKVFDAGNRVAGAVTGASTPTLDAYRNLNIDPTLAGDVTGSKFLQQMQAMAQKAPGGAGRMSAASGKAVDQFGRAVEDTASNLGTSDTLQQAGKALQLEGQNWLNQFKTDSNAAWRNVDMHIPQNTPVPVPNYQTALSDVLNQMPGAPATAATLQPSISRSLRDALVKDTAAGPLTWADVRGIRTRIGEALSDPKLIGDTGYTDLKRIYAGLSQDLEATVASRGPAAQQAFTDATTLTREGHGFIDNTLSRIIKGNQIAPEDAARNVLNTAGRGDRTLGAIRAEMPAAADELAAYKLRDMAASNPGRQNATGTQISPGTFLTQRSKLAPEAFDALFGHDPYTARRLGDLSTVADRMKSTEQFLNTSNTGTLAGTAASIAGLAGAIPSGIATGMATGRPLYGTAAGIGTALAPAVPGYLASRLTSTPWLTGLLAAPPAAPASSALLNRAAAFPAALRGLLNLP